MIEDMYTVMARIKELQSRFGLTRNKNQVTDKVKNVSYDKIHEKAREGRDTVKGKEVSEKERIDSIVNYYSSKNRVPSTLVSAIIEKESGYNSRALSDKGAMGLMQIMPDLAREYKMRDPYNPVENIKTGVSHLKSLLDEYDGDYKKALAAYNAGRGAVRRHKGVPDYKETREYVEKVINSYMKNR